MCCTSTKKQQARIFLKNKKECLPLWKPRDSSKFCCTCIITIMMLHCNWYCAPGWLTLTPTTTTTTTTTTQLAEHALIFKDTSDTNISSLCLAKTLDHQSVGDDRCDKDRETEGYIVGGGGKRKMFSEEGGGQATKVLLSSNIPDWCLCQWQGCHSRCFEPQYYKKWFLILWFEGPRTT